MNVFFGFLILIGLAAYGYFLWWVIKRDRALTAAERAAAMEADAKQEPPQPAETPLPSYDLPLSPNEKFLHAIRERSGYGTLRALHDALVYVAIAAIVAGSLYLCSIAPTALAGAIVVGVAALFVVALLIERWVFVLIVDAVDVYVDRTRREAEGK